MPAKVCDPRRHEQYHGITEIEREKLWSMFEKTVTDLEVARNAVELDAGTASWSVISTSLAPVAGGVNSALDQIHGIARLAPTRPVLFEACKSSDNACTGLRLWQRYQTRSSAQGEGLPMR